MFALLQHASVADTPLSRALRRGKLALADQSGEMMETTGFSYKGLFFHQAVQALFLQHNHEALPFNIITRRSHHENTTAPL